MIELNTRPTGVVECRMCGLPVAAGDPGVGSWSASGGVLTTARHMSESHCIRALALRVVALEALAPGQEQASG